MNRTPVPGSNLAAIGYDTTTLTLEAEFRHGGIYQYFDVPVEVYTGLMSAANTGQSVGSYFDQYVKKAGYRYRQIH
ncbi:KTSC domain-containing protein [Agreia bicolorata]|uniref:KTSC domain-containing protein n=1 Tax=Agreia bicolorata TaxID=110935 RepID=A0A1T4Y2F7_9MICO|nr:KTSC domain-containing protein [Agreia bicolorata]SKA95803.1 KTSC domain-containing protein [Agreia bicolorata]